MILIFDTETTGVIHDYKASVTEFEKFPRIIQLAWVLYDEAGNVIDQFCELIKADGWVVPKEQFWIENGFDTETNIEQGIDIIFALTKFVEAVNKSDLLVAHNINILPIYFA
jgi:DNA polymerase III epsilon subunit-like protein